MDILCLKRSTNGLFEHFNLIAPITPTSLTTIEYIYY